jgi:hypothetical protein
MPYVKICGIRISIEKEDNFSEMRMKAYLALLQITMEPVSL